MTILLSIIAIAVLLLAYAPMDYFVRWLRFESRIPVIRPRHEVGVPPWIVGSFERLMAFGLVLFNVRGAYTLLAAWIAAKLAASWHRFPVKNDEAGRQIRAGTLIALIAGIVSVGLGAVLGLVVRHIAGFGPPP